MNSTIIRRPIVSYLNKIRPVEYKKKIVDKLKLYLDWAKEPCIPDDKENLDGMEEFAYSLLGRCIMRVELLEQFNRELMRYASNYYSLLPWPKELWELKQNLLESANLARKLVKSVLHEREKRKNADGNNTEDISGS